MNKFVVASRSNKGLPTVKVSKSLRTLPPTPQKYVTHVTFSNFSSSRNAIDIAKRSRRPPLSLSAPVIVALEGTKFTSKSRKPSTLKEVVGKDVRRKEKRKVALENKTRFGFDPATNAIRVDGRTYRGATNVLKNVFYSNYKCPVQKRTTLSGNKRRIVMTEKRRASIRRHTSSKVKGDIFHRHVYHFFMCQEGKVAKPGKRKRCNHCKDRFGSYATTVTTSCDLFIMIEGVIDALNKEHLVVVSCEVPAAWRRMNTGTLLDMVCMGANGFLVVIELKTGYGPQFRKRPSTIGTPGHKMVGIVGKHIPNSPFDQHMLQLWFGTKALEDTHGRYVVEDGLLMYFDNHGGCDSYWLSSWKPHKNVNDETLDAQLYKVAVLGERCSN